MERINAFSMERVIAFSIECVLVQNTLLWLSFGVRAAFQFTFHLRSSNAFPVRLLLSGTLGTLRQLFQFSSLVTCNQASVKEMVLRQWICEVIETSKCDGRFPLTKNFRKFILRLFIWEERVPFATSPICLQAPLCRFTKQPDGLVNCSAIFSNMSSFVTFPPNKCLLLAYVVMRSLTSASSHLSRFTLVETSPVNEELQKDFSDLFGKRAPAKKLWTSKNFYLPLLYVAHSCCSKFSRSGARTRKAEHL